MQLRYDWVVRPALLLLGIVAGVFPSSVMGQAKPPQKASSPCGPLINQTLPCPRFGFNYKVPFGWVDRTADMQEESAPGQPNPDDANAKQPASSSGSETLLAVFERPPGASGDTVNSAVVIAAEPQANYHGIKTAAEYFGAINELAQQRGFKPSSDPYMFSVGTKSLVRGDFSKPRGGLTMYQTSLSMIEKGYIVSFTFIGGSEDEVNDLIGNLSFAAHVGGKAKSK
ncbi:MAG TPA: hypothetical protein VFA85_05955 [Terriglobales bacterium]|nr:hypothetical protein [Terriglobales bacterium]